MERISTFLRRCINIAADKANTLRIGKELKSEIDNAQKGFRLLYEQYADNPEALEILKQIEQVFLKILKKNKKQALELTGYELFHLSELVIYLIEKFGTG